MLNPFDLLKNPEKINQYVNKMKEEMETITATGTAGGDMVTVTINGLYNIEKLTISDEAYSLGDKDTLTVLITSAFNAATANLKEAMEAKTKSMGLGMGF